MADCTVKHEFNSIGFENLIVLDYEYNIESINNFNNPLITSRKRILHLSFIDGLNLIRRLYF